MRAHSVVEKFCRELKKKRLTRKNSLNKQTNKQPFLPFSENIFTGCPSSPSYESYTKKKKKDKPWMNVNEKMAMVFDNKNIV